MNRTQSQRSLPLRLCEAYRKQHGCDFISVMPSNLYGLNDNYHPENSHVPAALIRDLTKPNCPMRLL